jgi:hypothetical protein
MHFRYVLSDIYFASLSQRSSEVRNYVDGMKNSDQLLDLLSATGSDEVEPTRVVAGRTAFYADVRLIQFCNFLILISRFAVSSYVHPRGGSQSRSTPSRSLQCKSIQLP